MPSRIVSRFAAVFAIVAFVTAGCSSGDSGGASEQLTSDSETVEAAPSGSAAVSELETRLLTLADAPSGWSIAKDQQSDSPFKCVLAARPADGVETARVSFQDGSGGDQLSQRLVRYADIDAAAADLAKVADALGGCDENAKVEGHAMTFTGSEMSFPAHGEQSRAISATLDLEGATAAGAMYAMVRVGDVVAFLTLASDYSTPYVGDLEDWAAAAVDRLQV